MASGTISFVTNKTMMGRLLWSSQSNGTAANSSELTCTLQVKKTTDTNIATTGTWTAELTIGGQESCSYLFAAVDSEAWVTLSTETVTVFHSGDGSANCYLHGSITGPTETTLSGISVSGSETVSLDTIPRFAEILTAPNFYDDENPKITYSNPAGSSVTLLRACISLDGTADDIAYRDISKTGASYTFALTEAEKDVLRAATTGANSRTVRFYVRSEIGASYKDSWLPATFSIKKPEPTISPTVTDTNTTTADLTGDSSKLVKYYSNAAVTTGATAVKKATLSSQKVSNGTKSLNGNGTINAVESKTFLFTATDNRGNTAQLSYDAPFVEYVKLTCNVGENKPTTSGAMTLKVTGKCFAGFFGKVSNTLEVKYKCKVSGGSYPSEWSTMTVTTSGTSYTATASLSGLDYQKAYTFQAYAKDKLATVYSAEKTVMAMPVYDWSAKDFAFHVPAFDQFGAKMGNGLAAYTGSGSNGIDPNTTLEGLCLTSHGNGPQGVGNAYYIQTVFYNTKSTDANRAQLAFPYNKTGPIYHRYYFGGAWSAWAAPLPSPDCADLDTALTPGMYGVKSTTANLPETRFGYATLLVQKSGGNSIFQTLTEGAFTGNFVQMVRYSNTGGSSWHPWCWVNPPMVSGVEYRTTELFANKAVYTKLVELGALPNAVTKAVAHNVAVTQLLRVSGVTSAGTAIPYRSGASFGTITANKNNVVVYYSFDASADTGTAQIWYTKD